jgi:ribose transport system substrate-binding protein
MQSLAKWRVILVLTALVCSALLLAACGGSGGSSSSTGGGGDTSGETSGGESIEGVEAPVTSPPTELEITEPLKEPVSQHSVTWLACALPVCQSGLSAGYHEATTALGWPIKQLNYETLKVADSVQQALNENPDFITITGIPPALFESQSKEAIKKEIPIFSCDDVTAPEPKVNGLYVQCNSSESVAVAAREVARWIIGDSGGAANVLSVTIEEYPILGAEIEGLEKEVSKCAGCSVSTLPVTVEDIGEGKVPAKIIAELQSHPDINYIYYSFSDLSTGVLPALKAAGLDSQVKSTGSTGSAANMKAIAAGEESAWSAQAQQLQGWVSLDAAARVSQGMPLEPFEQQNIMPTYVVADKAGAEEILNKWNGEWPGPEGFEEQLEELWGVK